MPASKTATLTAIVACADINSRPNAAENQSGSTVIAQSTDGERGGERVNEQANGGEAAAARDATRRRRAGEQQGQQPSRRAK